MNYRKKNPSRKTEASVLGSPTPVLGVKLKRGLYVLWLFKEMGVAIDPKCIHIGRLNARKQPHAFQMGGDLNAGN